MPLTPPEVEETIPIFQVGVLRLGGGSSLPGMPHGCSDPGACGSTAPRKHVQMLCSFLSSQRVAIAHISEMAQGHRAARTKPGHLPLEPHNTMAAATRVTDASVSLLHTELKDPGVWRGRELDLDTPPSVLDRFSDLPKATQLTVARVRMLGGCSPLKTKLRDSI